MKSLWLLPAAWAVHVLLWFTWEPYTYGYGVPLPDFISTIVIRMFHFRQTEDLADVRRYSWLIAGFILWSAIALIVWFVLKSSRQKPVPI